MKDVYTVCLIIGVLLPIIALVFNFLDFAFDFITLEAFDIDFLGFDICFLPLSALSLCSALIMFGTLGLMLKSISIVPRNIIAGISAYILAVIIQSLIRYLKKHTVEADDDSSISSRNCFVVNRIPKDGYGSIVCKADGKSDKMFVAISKDNCDITQDTEVVVYKIENNIAVVFPKILK